MDKNKHAHLPYRKATFEARPLVNLTVGLLLSAAMLLFMAAFLS